MEESGGDVLSCQLNQLSGLISSLSDIQSNVCNLGVENCEMDCENRLETFKNYFRMCFSIPNKYSIDEVLEKAKNPAPNQNSNQKFCNEAMIRLAEKYKKQSLDKKSLLREDLKAKDIVRCEGIRSLKTAHYLNNFALSMCRQAQSQKMDEERRAKEEEEERLRKQKEESLRAKEAEEQDRLEKILAERQKKEDQVKHSKPAQKASTSKTHSASKSKNSKPAQKNKDLVSHKFKKKGKKTSKTRQSLKSKKSSKKKLSQKLRVSNKENRSSMRIRSRRSFPSRRRNRNRKVAGQVSFSKISHKSYGEIEANSSENLKGSRTSELEENPIVLAQADTNSKKCPVSMPRIRSAILYQSVKAPQIEPMKSQAKKPYNNYDLVRGKPAGVLLKLRRGGMNRQKEFAIDLLISGNKKEYYKTCFHEPQKGVMKEGEEDICSFTRDDLKAEGSYKFFPLPMQEAWLKRANFNHHVQFTLFPMGEHADNEFCHRKQSFQIKIIKTHSLKLAFTRIYGGKNCYASPDKKTGYDIVSLQRVRDFARSDEIDYILSMFPISGIQSSILRYKSGEKSYSFIKGSCNAEPAQYRGDITKTLLWAVGNVENIRSRFHYHKIFAIVSEDFFIFNNKPGSAGLVIRPSWEILNMRDILTFNWIRDFFGGSWNVAFVREDQVDQGTVAHELAHTLGQGREFYKPEKGPVVEYCREFKGRSVKACFKYKIPQGLRVWQEDGKQLWEFVKDRWSIMNNKGETIKDQWIDRDTHQKIFWTSRKYGTVIDPRINLFG